MLERYTRLEKIGSGSFGEVFLGIDNETGEQVAIKVFDLEDPRQDVQSVRREAMLLAECHCPYVTRYYGSFVVARELWMVMEFAQGGSLQDYLEGGGLIEAQVSAVMKSVVKALAYLHENGIFHRDIKSGNVLLTGDGGVKLADFGVSSQLANPLIDRKQTLCGTPFWMAPEVIEGQPYGVSADIWSLGITTYELATGAPPHVELEPIEALALVLSSEPPRLGPSYSPALRDFVAACLVRDPAQRPSARELLQHEFLSLLDTDDEERALMQALITERPLPLYESLASSRGAPVRRTSSSSSSKNSWVWSEWDVSSRASVSSVGQHRLWSTTSDAAEGEERSTASIMSSAGQHRQWSTASEGVEGVEVSSDLVTCSDRSSGLWASRPSAWGRRSRGVSGGRGWSVRRESAASGVSDVSCAGTGTCGEGERDANGGIVYRFGRASSSSSSQLMGRDSAGAWSNTHRPSARVSGAAAIKKARESGVVDTSSMLAYVGMRRRRRVNDDGSNATGGDDTTGLESVIEGGRGEEAHYDGGEGGQEEGSTPLGCMREDEGSECVKGGQVAGAACEALCVLGPMVVRLMRDVGGDVEATEVGIALERLWDALARQEQATPGIGAAIVNECREALLSLDTTSLNQSDADTSPSPTTSAQDAPSSVPLAPSSSSSNLTCPLEGSPCGTPPLESDQFVSPLHREVSSPACLEAQSRATSQFVSPFGRGVPSPGRKVTESACPLYPRTPLRALQAIEGGEIGVTPRSRARAKLEAAEANISPFAM